MKNMTVMAIRYLLVVLVGYWLCGCARPLRPFILHGNMPLVEPETKLYFPSYMCDLEKAEMTVFPQEGLGLSFSYADRYMAIATFYIYDMTLDTISNGLSEIISDSFERTIQEVRMMEQLGYYRDIRMNERGTSTLIINGSEIDALFAECSYLSDNLRNRSYILMAGYRNKILKIRYSFPEEAFALSGSKWECLTQSLGDSLYIAATASR